MTTEELYNLSPEPKKWLWHIEKFLPLFCPKCNRKFGKQNKDFAFLFGDIVDDQKVPRFTPGYDIIICAHCNNHTARVILQRRMVETEEEAKLLVEKEGFTNLFKTFGVGTHAQPRIEVFNKEIVGAFILHPHWPPPNEDDPRKNYVFS